MGAPRRNPVIKSRKRVVDEGEEDGPPATVLDEDSLSEGSIISEADDDADGESSDDSGTEPPTGEDTLPNGDQGKNKKLTEPPTSAPVPLLSSVAEDTEAMMNGLKISAETEPEEVHFDDIGSQAEAPKAVEGLGVQPQGNMVDRKRKEHEEYRKKRDADPAFVPNRGGFFMHDQRSATPGQNGFRPFGRGGARGRGGPRSGSGPFTASSYSQPPRPADTPWSHDLHETVVQPESKQATIPPPTQIAQARQRIPVSSANAQPPNRSFSKTTRLGDVQVRILLQGMAQPILFSGVPRNTHTRLPHHRPPLRRDKPVRISIPDMGVRYIFPSVDRSFIFIPRALRPNQQGFGRAKGRGSFGAGYGSFGPLSSRRTSVYAGSAYSPSAAMSRRSSLAREVSAADLASPAHPMASQNAAVRKEAGKPVVRLPPAAEQGAQQPALGDPNVNLPQSTAYPPLQKPTYHENRAEDLPMHHPKPERSLQVADIESPAAIEFHPPPTQQQPFHQQVPMQMAAQGYPPGPLQIPHSRNHSHPSQASGSTPLPHVPEAAIHAQPFQPYPFPPQQHFYPQQFPPPMYLYPADHGAGSPVAAPAFVPGQQYFYPMAMPPGPIPSAPPNPESFSQSGTVAHEAGGMVYYYNPTELAPRTDSPSAYLPPYTTAPPTGMSGMAQAPYYPPPQAFYPPPQ